MPIYNVQAPNGKIYKVEGPENADPTTLFGFVQQQVEADDVQRLRKEYGPGVLGTFGRGVKRGAGELASTFTDIIPAAVGSAFGQDEYAKEQMAEAAQKRAAREAEAPAMFRSYKDVEGIGDVPRYLAETIGEQVPNIATTLIPGVGAEVMAARAGMGAAGRAAASGAGVYLGSYAQNAPEVFQNIYENTGQLAPGAAAIWGAASAALDSVLPAKLVGKLTGPAKAGIVEKILEKSGMDKGLLRSVTANAISATPMEGLTEGAQEAISIAAENFVANNPQVFGSKEWNRIMESAVKGAVAGGAFGGAGGAAEYGKAGAERRAAYADALERRGDRQQAAEVRRQSAEIEAMQGQQPQMDLPGFEMGPATGLYTQPAPEPAGPKELKGKQAELFTPEGELTPGVAKAATRDEKIEANKQRQEAQRQAAELKEAQAKLKKFLSAKQATLPGFDEESVKTLQAQAAEQQRVAEETGQGDLFNLQPKTTPAVTPEVQPAPPSTVLDDAALKGMGIGHTSLIRKNKLLEGKDISKPEDAAEVKRILEAYVENRSQPIREKVEAFLGRPEFQGATDVAGPVTQPTGASTVVPSESSVVSPAGAVESTEPSGMVSAGEAAGKPAGREGSQPGALTERQQRIEFGKALGAAQPYPGMLQGRKNLPAQKAAVAEDFPGVVNALAKSKNATVAEVARRAQGLGTKIKIDDQAEETYEGRSVLDDQMSIDGAKMHLDALNKLRQLAPVVNQLPEGAALPYEITRTPIETYSNGEKHYAQLNLNNIVENNNSMFTGLGLPEGRALRTKEDFNNLLDAFERTTQELGEDKLRMTSTASAIRQGVAGKYDADTNTISVPEYYARNEAVLAHEIVHAQAVQAIANPTKEQKPVVARLDKLFDHVKNVVDERAKTDNLFRMPYGVQNTQEFVAEGLSNPDFQYLLSRIKYENTTAWDKFVEAIAKLLGLKNDNALTELLMAYSELTNKPAPTPSAAIAEPKKLGKRAKKDLAKAEAGAAAAKEEQAQFVKDVDNNVDSILTARLREAGREAGLTDSDLPSDTYRGSDAHNLLRLPHLFAQYRDSEALAKESAGTPQEAKNQQQMQQIEEEIAKSGPDALAMFQQLRGLPINRQNQMLTEINRVGLQEFDKVAQDTVSKVQAEIAAQKAAPAEKKELTDEELDALTDDFASKFFEQTGRKIFLPAYQGPSFNQADAALAQKGDLNGLLRSMLDQIKDPAIKQVLRRLRSLNLNAKIVIAPVEDGKAGSYDPVTNTITLDPKNGLNAHTFIHESVHAALAHVLANPNHPLTKDFTKFFAQIKDRMGAAYGAQDLQEFAAELVGNPSFQALLKTIKTPKSDSLFTAILRKIAEFFGFHKTAFDTGLDFLHKAIDLSGNVEPTATQKMFNGMGNFPAVGAIGKVMPALAGRTIESTKNFLSNLQGTGVQEAAFGLLRLDNINQMYGKELPSIQTLLDSLEKRNGAQERMIKTVNSNYHNFRKVEQKYRSQMQRMSDIAIDARLAQVDLLNPKFQPDATNQAEYARLGQAFRALPKEVQDVYRTIRKDYDASFNRYMKILHDAASSVSPSLAARLNEQFELQKPLVSYVPFLRSGDYWVEFTDPKTGEPAAHAFESLRERQQFIDSTLKGTPHRTYQNIQDVRFSGEGLPPTSFILQVMNGLRNKGASQEQLDNVYQAYLTTFPAQSIMKQFMKSKNVAGMQRDIINGYGDVMVRWARKLANSEYVPQIDKALHQIRQEAGAQSNPTVYAAAQNVMDQSAFFHNPNFGTFTSTATTLSYAEYILGNISSALINVTSLPMMVYPMLTGKFGWGDTTAAMTAAGKTAMGDWSKNARYKNLYDTLMDHAQLEHTMAREVLEGRRQKTSDYLGIKARILDGLSIPFAATEKYNRGVTAIAAYDLARKSGMNEDAAVRYALNTVKDVHTSGLAATGPRWMQTPMGRMFFTFKSFVWNSAYVMARAFHQAFKGENPEIRKAAQRQLLATYGMATVFTGIKGMPFYGATSVLAQMINALFGDDDEPFDYDEFLRDIFGEFLYKGAFNYATNLEVSNRAGIATDLLFRDDPRGIAEHGYVLSAMQQMFGPAGTIAVNSGNAIKMMQEGHVERAIETMAPSFVRNFMKGARYMVEGATTLKGDPVMEDISAYNSLMQVIGFSPADLSSQYERVQAAKGYEREVLARRTQLLQLYDMGHTAGDYDLMSDASEKIQAFNEHHPKDKITPDTIRRSIRARQAAEKEMIHGVRFNKKLRGEIEDKFFDEE